MSLFGKTKDEVKAVTPKATGTQKEAAYFGKNLKIKGNVSGGGDLIVLGELEGEFDLNGKLQVAEHASINGNVKANDIIVKGNIQGTLSAVGKIQLDAMAKVKGDLNCSKISVMEGAVIDGKINMSGQSAQTPFSAVSDKPLQSKSEETSEKK
jgi:cytoskeletal protein CcmA (bactofilin family)